MMGFFHWILHKMEQWIGKNPDTHLVSVCIQLLSVPLFLFPLSHTHWRRGLERIKSVQLLSHLRLFNHADIRKDSSYIACVHSQKKESGSMEKIAIIDGKPVNTVMVLFSKQDKAPLFGSGESSWKIFRLDNPTAFPPFLLNTAISQ